MAENLELGSHTWDLAAGWSDEVTGDVLRGPNGTWMRLAGEACFVTPVLLSDDEVVHVRSAFARATEQDGVPLNMQVERIDADLVVTFVYAPPPQTQWSPRPPIGERRRHHKCHVKQKAGV